MKFEINNQQLFYFEKHRKVELEGFFSASKLQALKSAIDQSISDSMEKGSRRHPVTAAQQFAFGHDLWRKSPVIKKVVLDPSLGAIAAHLIDKKSIRLGYDQYIPNRSLPWQGAAKVSLNDLCYFQGVLCGLLISLAEHEFESETSLFPRRPGNVTFFGAEELIDFEQLNSLPAAGPFLLVVYVAQTTLYIRQERDPHVHEPKLLGYAFGDRLKDSLHPIIHR